MDSRYISVATVPQSAIKLIEGGRLSGKTDINPQWRWETLTETYGLCGIGWKFDIVSVETIQIEATKEVMIQVKVNLYIKDGETWSAPVPGYGGDFIVVKERNGLRANDEGYKMAVTDALGTAAKMIGVGADIYRGLQDTKINAAAQREAKAKSFDATTAYKKVVEMAAENGMSEQVVNKHVQDTYKKSVSELTRDEMSNIWTWASAYEVVDKGN